MISMDFTVNTALMYEAIRAVERIAPRSSPIHVLKCAYIECDADTGQITLYSTNYATSIAFTLQASVSSGGKLLLEARTLSKVLEMLCRTKRDTVRFALHMGNILITSEKSQYLFPQMVDDYPKPSFEVPGQATTIEGKQISQLASKSSIAAAPPDSQKDVLKSVHLVISANTLSMTSTDGQCICCASSQRDNAFESSVLVPAVQFGLFAAIAQGYDSFKVGITPKGITFSRSNMMVFIAKVPGQFIDADSILGVATIYAAEIDVVTFRSLIENAALYGSNYARLAIGKGEVFIEGSGPCGGTCGQMAAGNTVPTGDKQIFFLHERPLAALRDCAGPISLRLTAEGHMLLSGPGLSFFQVAYQPRPAVINKEAAAETSAKQKKKSKKKVA